MGWIQDPLFFFKNSWLNGEDWNATLNVSMQSLSSCLIVLLVDLYILGKLVYEDYDIFFLASYFFFSSQFL